MMQESKFIEVPKLIDTHFVYRMVGKSLVDLFNPSLVGPERLTLEPGRVILCYHETQEETRNRASAVNAQLPDEAKLRVNTKDMNNITFYYLIDFAKYVNIGSLPRNAADALEVFNPDGNSNPLAELEYRILEIEKKRALGSVPDAELRIQQENLCKAYLNMKKQQLQTT